MSTLVRYAKGRPDGSRKVAKMLKEARELGGLARQGVTGAPLDAAIGHLLEAQLALLGAPKAGVSPISNAAARIYQEFGLIDARWKKPDAYRSSIENLIALTSVGKSVLKCSGTDLDSPFVVGPIQFSYEHQSEKARMSLGWVMREANRPRYTRVLHFALDLDPLSAAISYVHELQHVCRSKDWAAQMAAEDRSQTSESRKRNERITVQAKAIDEIRARKKEYDFFLEIARELGPDVCGRSIDENGGIITLAEHYREFEMKMRTGSFPGYVIAQYTRTGQLNPEYLLNSSISQVDEIRLNEEMVNSVRAAGF